MPVKGRGCGTLPMYMQSVRATPRAAICYRIAIIVALPCVQRQTLSLYVAYIQRATMVKHIHVTVEDDTHEQLKEAKGDRDWREVVFDGCGVDPAEAEA